jgi:hypothetical protein
MRLPLLAAVSLLAAGSPLLHANPIPYPSTGSPVVGSTTVTANGGQIDAWFCLL